MATCKMELVVEQNRLEHVARCVCYLEGLIAACDGLSADLKFKDSVEQDQ